MEALRRSDTNNRARNPAETEEFSSAFKPNLRFSFRMLTDLTPFVHCRDVDDEHSSSRRSDFSD